MTKSKKEIFDEFADYKKIPSWFERHIKGLETKGMVVRYSCIFGKNEFYRRLIKHDKK